MTSGERHLTRGLTGITWCESQVNSGCGSKTVAKIGFVQGRRGDLVFLTCVACPFGHTWNRVGEGIHCWVEDDLAVHLAEAVLLEKALLLDPVF